jgi:2'-5' RNA ligase
MAKERLKSPRARLFVALDLPDEVRDRLREWQRSAVVDPALRPLGAAQLHVTLCFLGYHPEARIDAIAELVRGVGPRPVELRFERALAAIPARRPRAFAADAKSDSAISLQAELSDLLAAEGFYEPEKRPFWPHVTMARVRAEKGRRGRFRTVESPPGPLPDTMCEPFGAVRVALYRSILRPTGAEYASLAELDLPPVEAEKR